MAIYNLFIIAAFVIDTSYIKCLEKLYQDDYLLIILIKRVLFSATFIIKCCAIHINVTIKFLETSNLFRVFYVRTFTKEITLYCQLPLIQYYVFQRQKELFFFLHTTHLNILCYRVLYLGQFGTKYCDLLIRNKNMLMKNITATFALVWIGFNFLKSWMLQSYLSYLWQS